MAGATCPNLPSWSDIHDYVVRMTSPGAHNEPTRVLLIVQGREAEAAVAGRLAAEAGLTAPLVVTVTEENTKATATSLTSILSPLTSLEVVVLIGPLASETWRAHGAFQLHLTLIDAPTEAHVPGAIAGALAMLG